MDKKYNTGLILAVDDSLGLAVMDNGGWFEDTFGIPYTGQQPGTAFLRTEVSHMDSFVDGDILFPGVHDLMAIFVPEEYKRDVGSTYTLGKIKTRVPVVGSLGKNFDFFHPLYYFAPQDNTLKDTIVLCTRDFKTANEMFPYWRFSKVIFERMLLLDPTSEEINELQNLVYMEFQDGNSIYKGYTFDEYTKYSGSSAVRAFKLDRLLATLVPIVLIIMFIVNTLRMVEANVAEYTIHHLYGATINSVRLRVGGFVVLLNFLPVLYSAYKTKIYYWSNAEWFDVALLLGLFVLALSVAMAIYAGRRVGTLSNLSNLRRDY